MKHPSILLASSSLLLASLLVVSIEAAYPAGFYNKTGCLYSHIADSSYLVLFPDGTEQQRGTITKFNYDDSQSNCTSGVFPGNLVVQFPTQDNFMHEMTLKLQLKPAPSEGYWEVKKATLDIKPVNKDQWIGYLDPIQMLPIDMYSRLHYSYSCSSLQLESRAYKGKPFIRLTLNRFQIQPSAEGAKTVFQPSYDCAVWITLPVLMGLILLLFITFTVMIGVNLIVAQGNQTGDLRFSKQGGMLMNQAQLDATKG